MSSRTDRATDADEFANMGPTMDMLVKLGALDDADEVVAALETAANARNSEAAAEAALAHAREQVSGASDPHARRIAVGSLADHRAAWLDARNVVTDAERALQAARCVAFHRLAPIVQVEYLRVLNDELAPALEALTHVYHRLEAIEMTAAQFGQSSASSIGSSTSPFVGGVANRLRVDLVRWRDVLERYRRASVSFGRLTGR